MVDVRRDGVRISRSRGAIDEDTDPLVCELDHVVTDVVGDTVEAIDSSSIERNQPILMEGAQSTNLAMGWGGGGKG